MYEFIEYVLWELKNSFALVLLAGIAAMVVLGIAYFIHRRKYKGEKKFPWGRVFLWLVFLGYMIVVIYATMLRWTGFFHREWNFHLFRAWREAWNNFSVKNWANVLLNVAMFVPLGVLFPLIWNTFRKWYIMIPTGFGVSLVIELMQLALGRGICDVDDLLANGLGSMIGYFGVMLLISLSNEKGNRLKPAMAYAALTGASVLAVGSVFIAYGLQEYGNLPEAASYRTDTGAVTWTVSCELPDEEAAIAAYRTQVRSLADCDAFAADFMETVGADDYDISYYQEAAYYMDHSMDYEGEDGAHFLYVDYLDTSYAYSCSFFAEEVWVDADRASVEAALSEFPVSVPEYAEFSVDGDGWHSFRVSQHIDGATMIDGVLECRYEEGGTIREIKNELLTYTYYEEVQIISPAAAFAKLCRGDYYDMNAIVLYSPEEVVLCSYSIGYEIDTKGFYQPVYYFHLESPNGEYQTDIMIPAMK